MGDLLLPKLSISMEEGRLVRWLVESGAEVSEGEPVAIVETDKAEVEVEAPESGPLEILVAEGEIVPVESTIGRIGGSGAPAAPAEDAAPDAAAANGEAPRHGGITAADLAAGSPPAGSFAAVAGAGASSWPAAQAAESVPAAAVAAAAAPPDGTGRRFASPAARRRARELGVDIAEVRGRGPGGRVVVADVEDHAAAARPAAAAAAETVAEPAGGAYPTELPAPGARPAAAGRSVAELRPAVVNALVHGWQTIPHVNVGGELDAGGLVAARRTASREPVKVTYTDLLLLALARALRDVPELAGTLGPQGFQPASRLDLNVAVATPDGVVAPVIVDVTSLGLAAIARERSRVVEAARGGQLDGRDLAPGACTLSNLGAYPVDFFTPVLSGPQVALVATGRIAERVVAQDGLIGIRPRLWANVCLDHRAADGEAGGRLLAALERRIAELPTSI